MDQILVQIERYMFEKTRNFKNIMFFQTKTKNNISCNLKVGISPQLQTFPVLQADIKSNKTFSKTRQGRPRC